MECLAPSAKPAIYTRPSFERTVSAWPSYSRRQSVVADLEKHLSLGLPVETFIEKQKLED